MRAQQNKVVDARLPSFYPVMDVMRVHEPRSTTTRERAVPIARPKRSPDRCGHGTLLATHVERLTALVLRHDDDARIAGEALDGFERSVCTADPSMEGCFIDMDHNLAMIGRRG
jgi:hypothetical protein